MSSLHSLQSKSLSNIGQFTAKQRGHLLKPVFTTQDMSFCVGTCVLEN